jgi:protein O-mannosyl-transferase
VTPGLVLLALWAWPPAFVMERYNGREFTLDERMLTQGRLLWHYLGWFFWPDTSAMGFQHDDIKLSASWWQPPSAALAWLAWLALGVAGYLLRARFPLLLYGFAFFLVGHALESSIWPLEMAYEHRNYLPTVGLALMLGGFLHKVASSWPQLRIQMLAIVVILPLVTGLALRTTAWSDTFSRVRLDVSNHPLSPRTHYFAGQAQFLQHESGESDYWGHENSLDLLLASRYQFEAMIALDPRDLAPLVMLYQIDKQYLPVMPDATDWMQRIATLLEDRRLQASDYAALKTLSRFFRERPQHADFALFVSIVDALRVRYPQSVSLIMLRYDLTAVVDDNILEQRALLEQARLAAPDYLEIYPTELMLARDNGDVAGVYQAGLRWLRADRLREHLPQLKRAFYGVAPQ